MIKYVKLREEIIEFMKVIVAGEYAEGLSTQQLPAASAPMSGSMQSMNG